MLALVANKPRPEPKLPAVRCVKAVGFAACQLSAHLIDMAVGINPVQVHDVPFVKMLAPTQMHMTRPHGYILVVGGMGKGVADRKVIGGKSGVHAPGAETAFIIKTVVLHLATDEARRPIL